MQDGIVREMGGRGKGRQTFEGLRKSTKNYIGVGKLWKIICWNNVKPFVILFISYHSIHIMYIIFHSF